MAKKITPQYEDAPMAWDVAGIVEYLQAQGGVTGERFLGLVKTAADPARFLCDAFVAVYQHNMILRARLGEAHALAWADARAIPVEEPAAIGLRQYEREETGAEAADA